MVRFAMLFNDNTYYVMFAKAVRSCYYPLTTARRNRVVHVDAPQLQLRGVLIIDQMERSGGINATFYTL